MASSLEAIIALSPVLQDLPFDLADSRVVALKQGFAMILYTEELQKQFGVELADDDNFEDEDMELEPDELALIEEDELSDSNEDEAAYFPFCITEQLETSLKELSRRGMVAYVETESFGGDFEQYAIIWNKGEVVFGPLYHTSAVSKALSFMGAVANGRGDEFGAIGLNERHNTIQWLINQKTWDAQQEEQERFIEQVQQGWVRKSWWRFW